MEILGSGFEALINYITIKRLLSLSIAFFLSGAIAQFMSQGSVIKYLGPKADKRISYIVAAVSGAILTVCSCSVLPMFASIRKKGAGIGPAIAFLFSGPAINVLAITQTFELIGVDVGFVRVISAMVLSLVIGYTMFLIYNKSEVVDANEKMFNSAPTSKRKPFTDIIFFMTLICMVITGVRFPVPTLVLLALLIIQLLKNFGRNEIIDWCKATFDLAKKIAPIFLVGIFLAGVIRAIIPEDLMVRFMGNNSYSANFIASAFGALMYFATLTEIPLVNSFIELGMFRGPATALLLAGPSLSIPNMIVISKVLGIKKTFTYVILVMILSALVAMLAGSFIYN